MYILYYNIQRHRTQHLIGKFIIRNYKRHSFTDIKWVSGISRDTTCGDLVIPEWIWDNKVTTQIVEQTPPLQIETTSLQDNRLKKIRPFRLNQLSVFNSNPYKLSKPVLKNPLIKHLWKLRVNPTYRHSQSKRLVISSSVVKHMFLHTNAKFDVILTTNKKLLDFVLNDIKYSSRYSRVQLVDKSVLEYTLRGTSEASVTADTVAEVFLPKLATDFRPRVVLAFDSIKYSQNLGSLIRTALAFNVDLIYYLKGTTDPFNWKVSMVSGGIQYNIPYLFGSATDLKLYCKENKLLPLVGHIKGTSIDSLPFGNKGVCIILGNESEGPNTEVLAFAKKLVSSQ